MEYPIRCRRIRRYLSLLWYGFTCWAWHRYSTVKPRTLSHTWCDAVELLPHTMFEILSRFVEKECSPGPVDWYHKFAPKVVVNGKTKFVRDEIQDLYDWWHQQYLIRYPVLRRHIWNILEEHNAAHRREPAAAVDNWMSWPGHYATAEQQQRATDLFDYLNDLDCGIAAALNRRLIRLVNIRRYLWT